MSDAETFYALRDARTREYTPGWLGTRQVFVAIGRETAMSAAGQVALLALANQLARVHRVITFEVPDDVRLIVRSVWPGGTLRETLFAMVSSIDPFGTFTVGSRSDEAISVGIGKDAPPYHDWYLGADRALGFLAKSPTPIDTRKASCVGAALASCLGAAAIFRTQLRLSSSPRTVSAWGYGEGPSADPGPSELEPLNIGSTLLVGAGAVAAALVYWLNIFGVRGAWTVIDKDVVKLHNTNRGLVFVPAHCDWPDLRPERMADKAALLASMLPEARHDSAWYDESAYARDNYDVVLGLANSRNVRDLLAWRNNTVTLHATTSPNWGSELHRHIVGRDDCIWCRAGDIRTSELDCSTAVIERDEEQRDAALPFLSAASGLMLATALFRLQRGELHTGQINDWHWDFDSTFRMTRSGVRRCRDDCKHLQVLAVRQRINIGSRWSHLDPQ